MRRVPLRKDFRMDADAAAEQIETNTIALVGVAGTTEYGMVDPIEDLARIAGQHESSFTSMRPLAAWWSRSFTTPSPSTSH